jgi:thiamine biosynthesis lipoprotein
VTELHAVAPFAALGTTASLVLTDSGRAEEALAILVSELDRMDMACSRFRPDSELARINEDGGGRPVEVSGLLFDAIDEALRAARLTDGRVDPTVGSALEMVGYDRDFASISPDGPPLTYFARPVPGWRCVSLDRGASTVHVPPGVRLDLGATAKALCADRAAAAIAEATAAGVLVGLGGDISVSGPAPAGGWPVLVGTDHALPLDGPGPVVAIRAGGLATSSTTVRRWRRGGRAVHHLIDPSTSVSAEEHWSAVSVAAGSCLDANIASCAAMLMGAAAPAWLEGLALPSRLVGLDGTAITVCGWPADGPEWVPAEVPERVITCS